MSVEMFIARRYLLAKRTVRFINVIGVISIAGITIGVAALLVALSVFNGFNDVVTSVLVGFDPHIRIEKPGGMSAAEYGEIAKKLAAMRDIVGFSPFVSGKAMLTTRAFTKVVFVRGIDEQKIGSVSGLNDKIVLGSVKLENSIGPPGMVIGLALADQLGSIVGNDIAVYGPSSIQEALTGMSVPQNDVLRVSGIFESNNKDYDASYAYISIPAAQHLFDLEGRYNGIEMRLSDFRSADRMKEDLERVLPSGLEISSWYDLHRNLYLVMTVERWSAYILLCLIIVVATFNMLGSLTMGIMEKERDIGVLKSLGMGSGGIVKVFMTEGLLIGCIGTFLGILLGLFVIFLQMKYQLFRLDTSVYIIPAIPVQIRWTDFVAIGAASLGLSFLAAYYPARRAASMRPSDALRWE
ncbi:MAG TPA: FtsX-like permease family protein [Bacteroidota bacterium]|nr:FtsX-like permease family protein [Bacteroidota bacterium]